MERVDKIRAIIAQIETMKLVGAGTISLDKFKVFMDKKTRELWTIATEIMNEGNYIEVNLMNKTLNEYCKEVKTCNYSG